MTANNEQSRTNVIQNKPNLHFTAENAEYAQKKNICVSDCSIKKYALYPISPCSLRTRRLMKNKAKQSQFQRQKKYSRCSVGDCVITILFYKRPIYERLEQSLTIYIYSTAKTFFEYTSSRILFYAGVSNRRNS